MEIKLPPGSVSIPLHKAPSGHLVMIIDEYEKIAAKRGGVPEASLQLHSEETPLEPQTTVQPLQGEAKALVSLEPGRWEALDSSRAEPLIRSPSFQEEA